MPDFRIQIDRLTPEKDHFEFEVSPGWWLARRAEGERETEDVRVETPFRFELEALRTGDDILIEGQLEGEIGLECSRCGKRYPHALREPYRLLLEPLAGPTAADPEGERGLAENGVCLGEDLEVGAYRGAVVGLDDFFGEVIALAMPIQPLCDEGCLGICPHCGTARTEDPSAACSCEDEKIESPFAVLAKLKSQD